MNKTLFEETKDTFNIQYGHDLAIASVRNQIFPFQQKLLQIEMKPNLVCDTTYKSGKMVFMGRNMTYVL